MTVTAITVSEMLEIIERLHPDSLLLVRDDTGLDEDTIKELWARVIYSFDPKRRLENIEYLLLILHDGRAKNPRAYLHKVFLPWMGIRRRLHDQVMRIVDDIANLKTLEAYTAEDAAHAATKIYRPLVADIFDPYMTLLVATYQFLDGNFTNIHETNVGFGERGKAEFVASRIKNFGGPNNILDGYDPIVRNALSHTGNEGVLYEHGSVLFKDIKRGFPATIQTRRWSHDDLHFHCVALIELFMSINAAVDIFGIDNMNELSEGETLRQVMFHALSRDQRIAIAATTQEQLQRIRSADKPIEERVDLLGKILFRECADRNIPCTSVGYSETLTVVNVPLNNAAVSNIEIQSQAIFLTRYAILARSVFGTLSKRFRIAGVLEAVELTSIELPGSILDEYAAETAGLIDLLSEADIKINGEVVQFVVNEEALSESEDAQLGPRFPRKGRPISD